MAAQMNRDRADKTGALPTTNTAAPANAAPAVDDSPEGKKQRIFDEMDKANVDYDTTAQKQYQDYKSKRDSQFSTQDQEYEREISATKDLQLSAQGQAAETNKVYKDLSTRYQNAMEDAETNAKPAMSLADYMDPNNKVATSTRALYDTQAEGEQKRGQADFGVLASLGSTAAAQSGANLGPMTVGQQMAMQSMGQRQAADAYSMAQKRVQALRDQGLQMGFSQSDKMYNAGIAAKEAASKARADRAGIASDVDALNAQYRQEYGGYDAFINAVNQAKLGRNMAGTQEDYGTTSAQTKSALERSQGIKSIRVASEDTRAQAAAAELQRQAAEKAAEEERNASIWASIIGAAGTVGGAVAGSYFGPAGTAGGASGGGYLGRKLGQKMADV
jgi:hypothetical protein